MHIQETVLLRSVHRDRRNTALENKLHLRFDVVGAAQRYFCHLRSFIRNDHDLLCDADGIAARVCRCDHHIQSAGLADRVEIQRIACGIGIGHAVAGGGILDDGRAVLRRGRSGRDIDVGIALDKALAVARYRNSGSTAITNGKGGHGRRGVCFHGLNDTGAGRRIADLFRAVFRNKFHGCREGLHFRHSVQQRRPLVGGQRDRAVCCTDRPALRRK